MRVILGELWEKPWSTQGKNGQLVYQQIHNSKKIPMSASYLYDNHTYKFRILVVLCAKEQWR